MSFLLALPRLSCPQLLAGKLALPGQFLHDDIMKCVVTAGPTFEPIDKVRRLTNFSTGKLGCGLAQYLAQRGHDVHLLLGETATCPVPAGVQHITRFSTTNDLGNALANIADPLVKAVFHVAAVSDFAPTAVWTRSARGDIEPVAAGKISSQIPSLWIELRPTPKIIARMRDWFPNATIVGWKFEVDGTRDDAVSRGRDQIAAYHTSACVVNGPAYGAGYALVPYSGDVQHFDDPLQLYEALARRISC
ncbi:MAG TPA: phosphopantothenoylcysteine decarboxylase [Verrucomicrobiota bacterium]|nr:phosphopantothenoylcysteine decarboxylase [Verrucomicrobiota bacterium]